MPKFIDCLGLEYCSNKEGVPQMDRAGIRGCVSWGRSGEVLEKDQGGGG